MKKVDLGVIVTTLIIVTISCSLAFFAARVVGDPKDINLVAKNVAITFADTSSIADTTISPGWSNVKTFTITNNSKEDFSYNIVLSDYVNTFVTSGYLQYKITSSDGYSMSEYLDLPKSINEKDIVIAYMVNIPKNSIQTYQVEFRYQNTEEDQSEDMGKVLKGNLIITEGTERPTLYEKILADNPTRSTRDTYNAVFTNNTTGTLFTATEKNVHNTTDTTVYYYAGNTTNNWVKFAGFYWRIIRTNADGSVRMLYSGTATDTISGYISESKFYTSYKDPMYVGYKWGTSGSLVNNRTNENDSTIKATIDNWYASNMTSYTKYLSTTAVYCNDRNLASGSTYSVSTNFNYAPYARVDTNYAPTYDCTETSDAFSGTNTSAKLTYPIALMTADEIMRAGGRCGKDLTRPYAWYYLNSANGSITGPAYWWLLSPYNWDGSYASVFFVGGDYNPGWLDVDVATGFYGVRPVISLKAEMLYKSGDGSASNPYEVVAEPVNTYTISLSVNNGSGTGTVLVEEGKDATFTVTPSDGYKAELETDTCGGTLSGNTYTISNITSGKTCSITFKKDNPFTKETLTHQLYNDKITKLTRSSFSSVLTTTNTKTLYTATEEGTTVYYFAGNATDNWVKFGGYYWRIIRTNSDGGVRLLYHGTSTSSTDAYIGKSVFNSTDTDSIYAGYMYGTSGSLINNRKNTNNSTIKTAIDNWYTSNMTSYTKYLSTTAVYCNDREVGSGTYSANGSSTFYYAAYTRLNTNKTPTYSCTNVNDKFTVDSSTGNGKLTYPIALMTADEVVFAGGKWGTNAPTWYYYNSANGSSTGSTYWWLLSPHTWDGGNTEILIINGSSFPGFLNGYYASVEFGIRPVISLKSCVKWKSGDGSASNPYTIEETTSGC